MEANVQRPTPNVQRSMQNELRGTHEARAGRCYALFLDEADVAAAFDVADANVFRDFLSSRRDADLLRHRVVEM